LLGKGGIDAQATVPEIIIRLSNGGVVAKLFVTAFTN
jgi:hypothetical protein